MSESERPGISARVLPGRWLAMVREARPLVHQITSPVSSNLSAGVVLAVGASPIMAWAREESGEVAGSAQTIVLNTGMLTPESLGAMIRAGKEAHRLGIPVVLDPVGAMASAWRLKAILSLLREIRVTVIRGNVGEIAVLSNEPTEAESFLTRNRVLLHGAKGVDGPLSFPDAEAVAVLTARRWGCVVAATGRRDWVTDGQERFWIEHGSPLMGRVIGCGCALSALVGVFVAVERRIPPRPVEAVSAAIAFYGWAGEVAAARVRGPGGFVPELLDVLYQTSPEEADTRCRVWTYPSI